MTGPAPLEIVVLTFPGTEMTPAMLTVLDVVEGQQGVTVVDLAVICRDADGTVRRLEPPDPPAGAPTGAGARSTATGTTGAGDDRGAARVSRRERYGTNLLIGEDDAAEIAELVEPGGCAIAAVVEHTWSVTLAEAAEAARGQVVAAARIGLAPEAPPGLDELIGLTPVG
jgi:hypothetical protein